MEIIGWVRQTDKAACGGIVCEGDPFVTSNGVPYTFQGAKLACKKNCVIAEGFQPDTLTNGRAMVHHGMRTSAGCPLLSTLNEEDGLGNEVGTPVPVTFFQNADGHWVGVPPAAVHSVEEFDEQAKLQHQYAEGLPYFIETMDGRTFSGRIGPDGLLPRIETHGEDEYTILWGDEALANMEQGRADD